MTTARPELRVGFGCHRVGRFPGYRNVASETLLNYHAKEYGMFLLLYISGGDAARFGHIGGFIAGMALSGASS